MPRSLIIMPEIVGTMEFPTRAEAVAAATKLDSLGHSYRIKVRRERKRRYRTVPACYVLTVLCVEEAEVVSNVPAD